MKKKDEIEKKERELGLSPGSYLMTLEAICRPDGLRVRQSRDTMSWLVAQGHVPQPPTEGK